MVTKDLKKTYQSKKSLFITMKTLFVSFICLCAASIIGIVITYVVSKNKVEARIDAGEKLSTLEKKEAINSLISTPNKIFVVLIILSLIGIVVFKILKSKFEKIKYDVEYEMKDAIEEKDNLYD